MADVSQTLEKPHYSGHRARLRERFLKAGGEGLADYELLEMLLFAAHPRGDVKPLAKHLLATFGSFAKVLSAPVEQLLAVEGMGEGGVAALKAVQVASQRLIRFEMEDKPVLQSWTALLDYCRLGLAHNTIEECRVLFLNGKNRLIADETLWTGTVNHTPLYPREVVRRALELGASAIILVHNHPSGDPSPSKADIDMTLQIMSAAATLGVQLHDHLIIGGDGHFSFKSHGII